MSDTLTLSRLRFGVFALWLLACAILLYIARANIAGLQMWDPDDYLRLQQVRDWLGGQSFFDVTQYRIDPPGGVTMHWSRIADLPIAALILLLRPVFGPAVAELVAASAVPLLILGGSLSALALITARLADRRAALVTAMLATTAPLILFHVMPLRIDHHGMQTMFGLFAVAACFDRKALRGGLIAGSLAAAWLAISLEALPMVTAIAALLALRFIIEGETAAIRFRAFTMALAAVGVLLFIGLHGRAAYGQPYCDAVSPAWFGPVMLAPALVAFGLPLMVQRGIVARIVLLLAAGVAGVALLALTAPACLDGPFAALDPLSRSLWYDNVLEGLPVWKQPAANMVMLIGFPPIGLLGSWIGWRNATSPEARRNWLMMLALLAAAFALALMVQRAGAFAHGCALPGAGYLVASLLDRIGRWRRAPFRILASAVAIGALSPVGALIIGSLALPNEETGGGNGATCFAPCSNYAPLSHMAPTYILTGLDLTPRFLVTTPHSFPGSGHHRGRDGIHRVIAAFTGPPEIAHRIMAERGMTHVLIDPDGNEASTYTKASPNGLMADLVRGRAPAWLAPVPMANSKLKIWKRLS